MDIRDRYRRKGDDSRSDGLYELWKEQEESEKEDVRIQEELSRNKARNKELRRTLRNKYSLGGSIKSAKLRNHFMPVVNRLIVWVKAVSSMRYARLGLILLTVAGISLFIFKLNSNNSQNVLGTGSSASNAGGTRQELPKEKPTDFDLLYPKGVPAELYETVKISPQGAAPSYTFIDRMSQEQPTFRVTQQEKPDIFDLPAVAEDFQATNIIEVDGQKIYHGYSEKGDIQSLIFLKNDILVTIRSSSKLADEQWAGYYLSLE